MTVTLRAGAATIALIAGLGVAAAQQPAQPGPDQQPPKAGAVQSPGDKAMNSDTPERQTPPAGQTPPAATTGAAPAAQDQAVAKPQTAPEQGEPESTPGKSQSNAGLPQAPGQDQSVFKNGLLNAPGAPQDSQTAPAKYSERNAKIDDLPIMAYPLALSDEQKQRIYDSVRDTQPVTGQVQAKPADILPSNIVLRDLPKEIAADIPSVRDLKYVKLQDKVVLVRAPNRIVVAEISK